MSNEFASKLPAMLIEIRRLVDTGQQREALEEIAKVEAAENLSKDSIDHNRLLSLKSIALHSIADYEKALAAARRALELVIGTSDNVLIAELQSTCARCLIELGQTVEAEHLYRDLVSTFRRLDDTINVIRTLNRLSRIYFIRGQFDRAATVLIEADDHARRIDSSKWQAMIHGNLGTIFNLTGDFGKAVEYLQESITCNRKLKADLNLCRAQLSLAFAFMHLTKFEAAVESLAAAEKLASENQYRPETAMLHQYRAQLALLKDEPAMALREAEMAKAIVTAGSAEDCQISRLLATAQLRLGNLEQAGKECRYAFELSRRVGEKVEEAACLRIKADLAQRNKASQQVVHDLLKCSADLLQSSGSQYELAQTWLLRAKLVSDPSSSREYTRRSYGILAMLGISDRPESGKSSVNRSESIALIGEDSAFRRAVEDAELCAESEISVLLLGKTGAGKDQLAKFIHSRSLRSSGPFIVVNCGAISAGLAESEFFGHEKGAFTDASETKKGLLEAARGGTLFLNEIGDLPIGMQVKLLAAIEEKEVYRVGGTTPRSVDFRLIAATNIDLYEAVVAGTFREDLFYRLNVMTIEVPSLMSRGDDVLLLLEHFISQSGLSLSSIPKSEREKLLADLRDYPWPGNVRELRNIVYRSLLTANRDVPSLCRQVLESVNRRKAVRLSRLPAAEQVDLKQEMAVYEEDLIRRALEMCDGVKRRAADYLGLPESSLRSKMKKFRIRAA